MTAGGGGPSIGGAGPISVGAILSVGDLVRAAAKTMTGLPAFWPSRRDVSQVILSGSSSGT